MPRAPELDEMLSQPKGGSADPKLLDSGIQDYLDTFADALTAGNGDWKMRVAIMHGAESQA